MTKKNAVNLIERITNMEESKKLLSFAEEFIVGLELEIRKTFRELNKCDFYLVANCNFNNGEIEEGYIFKMNVNTLAGDFKRVIVTEVFQDFYSEISREDLLTNFKVVSKSFVDLIGEYYSYGSEKYDRLAQQHIEIVLDSRLK